MNGATVELMNKGMKCLFNSLGAVETERFISVIMREQFDYTKWQRKHFDQMSQEEIANAAHEFADQYPHKGHAKIVL